MANEAVVTQEVVEVVETPNPAAVVTQEIVEVALVPSPQAVVTQEIVEVLFPVNNPGGNARLTQQTAEVAYGAYIPGSLTQLAVEVAVGTFIPGRLSQVAVEVLMNGVDDWVPQIYRLKRP